MDKDDPFEDSLERFLFHNRVTKRYKVRELISICGNIEDEVVSFSRWLCEDFRIQKEKLKWQIGVQQTSLFTVKTRSKL